MRQAILQHGKTEMDDIDTAMEQLSRQQQEFDDALAECEAQQSQGKTGMNAYRRAVVLYEDLKNLTEIVARMIELAKEDIK